jgi:hypothetical protein
MDYRDVCLTYQLSAAMMDEEQPVDKLGVRSSSFQPRVDMVRAMEKTARFKDNNIIEPHE